MTAYSPSRNDHAMLEHEIDDLLLHVRGLVLVRDLLARRGASQAELDEHTRELDRQRERLASVVRGGA